MQLKNFKTSHGILQVHMTIWRFFGLRTYATDSLTYKIYTRLLHFIFGLIFYGCVCANVLNPQTDEELSLLGTSIVVITVTLIKARCIMQNQQLCEKLMQLMNTLEKDIDGDEELYIWRARQNAKKAFVSLGGSALICGILFGLYAAVQPENSLIWPSVYPFDWQQNKRIYWAVLVLQFCYTMFYELLMTTSNTYGPSMFMLLTAYFEVLGLRLSRLGRSRVADEAYHDNDISEKELISCIKYHNLCFKYDNQ